MKLMASQSDQQFPEITTWPLEVVSAGALTPLMRRIELTGALDTFDYRPGQDLSFGFQVDGAMLRRRYTIRRLDPKRRLLEINVLLHGDGPGRRWAESAAQGTKIDAIGPRGKITLAKDAGWHLFAGDATALPAVFAMIEALPPAVPTRAYLQVDTPNERHAPPKGDGQRPISWAYEANDDNLLSLLSRADLPGREGHAYLAGEVALVRALKSHLLDRGWSERQLSAKAYWNRGQANAGNGEPEQRAS
jgi:NADPH-dependent ferric siderophore reductase